MSEPRTPATTPRTPAESALLETAARRLPGGVLGTGRFTDDLAFVVKRAQGSHLWDASGREYIDYLLGSGPMFLGHCHPAVVRAVTQALGDGSTITAASSWPWAARSASTVGRSL